LYINNGMQNNSTEGMCSYTEN